MRAFEIGQKLLLFLGLLIVMHPILQVSLILNIFEVKINDFRNLSEAFEDPAILF